jgi:hypothetical protein
VPGKWQSTNRFLSTGGKIFTTLSPKVTNASSRICILASMAKERRTNSSSISHDEFERRFQRAFGREMTAEERRFLKLANLLLDNELGIDDDEEIKSKGTAA